MEAPMTERVIKHEIKLQKSVIVILAVLTIGVCANAFAPAFSVKEALAKHNFYGMGSLAHPITIVCKSGC